MRLQVCMLEKYLKQALILFVGWSVVAIDSALKKDENYSSSVFKRMPKH